MIHPNKHAKRNSPYLHDELIIPAPSAVEDDWLLSYADVSTLLIVLFVLMLSFAGFDMPQYQAIKLAASPKLKQTTELPASTEIKASAEDERNSKRQKIIQHLKQLAAEGGYSLSVSQEFLQVTMRDNILFPLGQAQLSKQGLVTLQGLIPVLMEGDFEISVEGHTDNLPIATELFPSNWELSYARASSVARYLIANGIDARRLKVEGYADTKPIQAGNDQTARAANRRVSLRLSLPQP